MVDKQSLNELALFAGAGGGILGGKLLGWRTVCAVEWEPYPASVLCARQNDGFLPPFPIWDDIQTFDGKPWRGIVDVVSGRNGEPFEAVILKKNYLPNPVTRFCTIEMKIRTIANYLFFKGMCETRSQGEYMSWVGIRADEPRRSAKIPRDRTPLVTAGVTKEMVGEFWRNQPFDLELPNINGVTYHGNCDLCFLKGSSQTMSLIQEKPERAIWWAKMEALALASRPDGARFRKDRASYADMMKFAETQTDFFGNDETIPCFCGD